MSLNVKPHLGNRLALPACVPGKHFFYRTSLPSYRAEDAQVLINAIQQAVEDCGLHTAEIDVFSCKRLHAYGGDAVSDAFSRLVCDLGLEDVPAHTISLLACEWASVHVDDSFAGSAFLTLVLHTGPNPYVMQTFHSARNDEDDPTPLELHTSTRLLHPGQAVVFDPTTPHLAVPAGFSADQLLVLLQVELSDKDLTERATILRRYPPLDTDRSQEGIFNGFDG